MSATLVFATVEESITLCEPVGVHLAKGGLTFSRAVSIEIARQISDKAVQS